MAPNSAWVMRIPDIPLAATGAGCWGFTKHPSGAVTTKARQNPPLDCIESSVKHFITAYTMDLVKAKLGLMEPRAWGDVPSKSTYTVSPSILTSARMAMGCMSRPSLSR